MNIMSCGEARARARASAAAASGKRFAVQSVPFRFRGEFRGRQGARRGGLCEKMVRRSRQERQYVVQFFVGREAEYHIEPFVSACIELADDFGYPVGVVPSVRHRQGCLGEHLPAARKPGGGHGVPAAVEHRPTADVELRAVAQQADGSADGDEVLALVSPQQVDGYCAGGTVADAAQGAVLQGRPERAAGTFVGPVGEDQR